MISLRKALIRYPISKRPYRRANRATDIKMKTKLSGIDLEDDRHPSNAIMGTTALYEIPAQTRLTGDHRVLLLIQGQF
ncbi:MAG: hypothetical protein LBV59_12370 [Sphingobacterium sp.]|uniref:hypothetical protein n=1 Tax=Sphingobacterium sp. TaxID=341027 RepID=UPI00284B83FA|nr:hypothetical protein [Sphingobacterium sp.]MDR3008725.1 hypothetical protein [Sphingobacterium sp.]